jgi:predicted Zn-dependent protease
VTAAESGVDPAAVVRAAEAAVDDDPDEAARLLTLGAAHYRAGRIADAVNRLRAAQSDQDIEPFVQFYLALAYHRLGDANEGKRCRDRAIAWDDKNGRSASWQDRLRLRSLRGEADTLLGK